MSYHNELTKQQERSFKRRCRFTACGEPCDVFAGPTDPDDSTARDVMFMTINRNAETGAAWIEATSYIYADPTDEIRPDYLKLCRKIDEADAREIIARELRRWACMPEGTVTGWTPAQIAAEAERIEGFDLYKLVSNPPTFCQLYDFSRAADSGNTPRPVGYYAACNILEPSGVWYVSIYPEERKHYGVTEDAEYFSSQKDAARRAYEIIGY